MCKGKNMRRLAKIAGKRPEQAYCLMCDTPVSQNTFHSDTLRGICYRCFRIRFGDKERRSFNKEQSKYRQVERNMSLRWNNN